MKNSVPVATEMRIEEMAEADANAEAGSPPSTEEPSNNVSQSQPPLVRKDFNETVFFYPQLRTNQEGKVILDFKMRDALTTWRMMALAHTKSMQVGYLTHEVQTTKDLQITSNIPRFLRAGDEMVVSAKVTNLSDKVTQPKCSLQIIDLISQYILSTSFGVKGLVTDPTLKPGESQSVQWLIKVPKDYIYPIQIKVEAVGLNHSDAEIHDVPIVTNRTLVTEALPFFVEEKQTETIDFKKFRESQSPTLTHHILEVSAVSHPIWLAIQALPYLESSPHESVIQLAHQYSANAIGNQIITSNPDIVVQLQQWQKSNPKAFESTLNENQDLKKLFIEQTPWVQDAAGETAQRQKIASFFNQNRIQNDLKSVVSKILVRQNPDGSFPWFEGRNADPYVTMYVLETFGKLKYFGIPIDESMNAALEDALMYLDQYIVEVSRRNTMSKLSSTALDYLYVQHLFNRSVSGDAGKLYDQYLAQSKKEKLSYSIDQQAKLGSIYLAKQLRSDAEEIYRAMKENAVKTKDQGWYWGLNGATRNYIHPLETHALCLEFMQTMKDTEATRQVTTYLLRHKQTNMWPTNKITSAVIFGLLGSGKEPTLEKLGKGKSVTIKIAGKSIDFKNDPIFGPGIQKKRWIQDEVKEEQGILEVTNPNSHQAWGSIIWQYFENYDKVKASDVGSLKIKSSLFKRQIAGTDEQLTPLNDGESLNVGDRLVNRIFIENDRPMQYMHLECSMVSGVEPISALSGYQYQGGLGFYKSSSDLASHYFIHNLPKGSFVIEEDLYAAQQGIYSGSMTTLQSYYAPEFVTHSEGQKVIIKQ